MNYYEHHLGDYLRDAGHLSMIEDGAYRRLMDVCYSTERPLPKDLKEVCKLARANSKQEKDAVRYVLENFFRLTDAGYEQKRCQEEIERYRKKVEAASAAGKASAESRNRKSTTVQRPFNDRSTTVDDPLQICTNENSTLQTPYTSNQKDISERQLDENAEGFNRVKAAYPKFSGRQNWIMVSMHCHNRIAEGATWSQLEQGAIRYASFILATGQHVLNPVNFFSAADEPWRQLWEIPQAEQREESRWM